MESRRANYFFLLPGYTSSTADVALPASKKSPCLLLFHATMTVDGHITPPSFLWPQEDFFPSHLRQSDDQTTFFIQKTLKHVCSHLFVTNKPPGETAGEQFNDALQELNQIFLTLS